MIPFGQLTEGHPKYCIVLERKKVLQSIKTTHFRTKIKLRSLVRRDFEHSFKKGKEKRNCSAILLTVLINLAGLC